MSVETQKSIEEIIERHVARMQSISGHSDYMFDRIDLIIYLASEEAKAKSPPVIMPKTCDQVRLGTVYGDESKKTSTK